MNLFQQVFLYVGGSVAIMSAVLIALTVMFKQALGGWLMRQFTRRLDHAAELHKHELEKQRDKYRDELANVQNVERFRAEVRMSVAAKILESRLYAFERLHVALQTLPVHVLSYLIANPAQRVTQQEVASKLEELMLLIDTHGFHVPFSFRERWIQMCSELMKAVKDDKHRTAYVHAGDKRVAGHVRTMCRLDADLDVMLAELPEHLVGIVMGTIVVADPG